MHLNEIASQIHVENANWWICLQTGKPLIRNRGNLLMLVITELAEAIEGVRKNLPDDKLPHRRMEEVEMADAFIRLCDISAGFGHNLYNLVPSTIAIKYDDRGECMMEIVEAIVNAWQNDRGDMSLSVCIWLIRSYCLKFNLDLEGAMIEKRKFNQSREDHSIEHRRSEHGKRF